jgi:hypothetical protein
MPDSRYAGCPTFLPAVFDLLATPLRHSSTLFDPRPQEIIPSTPPRKGNP